MRKGNKMESKDYTAALDLAAEKFKKILEGQLERIEDMKRSEERR